MTLYFTVPPFSGASRAERSSNSTPAACERTPKRENITSSRSRASPTTSNVKGMRNGLFRQYAGGRPVRPPPPNTRPWIDTMSKTSRVTWDRRPLGSSGLSDSADQNWAASTGAGAPYEPTVSLSDVQAASALPSAATTAEADGSSPTRISPVILSIAGSPNERGQSVASYPSVSAVKNGAGITGGCSAAGITAPCCSWMKLVTNCCRPYRANTRASGSRIWNTFDLMARSCTSDDLAVNARNCAFRSNDTFVGSRMWWWRWRRGDVTLPLGLATPASAAAAAAAASFSSCSAACSADISLPLSSTRPAPVTARNTSSSDVRPTWTSTIPASSFSPSSALSTRSKIPVPSSSSVASATRPASFSLRGSTYSRTPIPRRSSLAYGATRLISSIAGSKSPSSDASSEDASSTVLASASAAAAAARSEAAAVSSECSPCLHNRVTRNPLPNWRLSRTGAPRH
mmetsp:Transcript_169962/g.413149  ORF Transcript_169962/g.413149 Transcript_169962/m.413149 type:complete len:459 (-) Transcript_169962:138-1514(-)